MKIGFEKGTKCAAQVTNFKKYSPFNGQYALFIIVKYEQSKSIKKIQRAFRREFYPKAPRKVPNIVAFTRILKRFKEETALEPQAPTGGSSEPLQNNIETYYYYGQNSKCHVRQAVRVLDLRNGAIWRISKKNLKWKAHKQQVTQCLILAKKKSRLEACTFRLSFKDKWLQRVTWSDEKWFVLKQWPNEQTYRHWAPWNCKKAHGEKVMAWVGASAGDSSLFFGLRGSVNSNEHHEYIST